MEDRNNNSNNNDSSNSYGWRNNLARFFLSFKRRLKLNRFLFVIDTKKGVTISAITIIIVDLIDTLWNLSMSFGPMNTTLTSLLVLETLLVVFISSVLIYAMKSENRSYLRSVLLIWLLVVAIDYILRASMIFSSLVMSNKAPAPAKATRAIASALMLALVAHCWLCVFTYYDDNNGKIKNMEPNMSNNPPTRNTNNRSHRKNNSVRR